MTQTEIFEGQEILVAVDKNSNIHVLSFIGDGVREACDFVGRLDLFLFGFYSNDIPSEDIGIYYWKGTLKKVITMVEALSPRGNKEVVSLGVERYWEGEWFDATIGDLNRFGMDQEFGAKSFQC